MPTSAGNELINNWAAAATGEDGQIVIRGGTVDAGQFADNTFRHNSAARVSVRFGTASAPSVSINKTAFKVNHSATNPHITIGNVTYTPGNLVVMNNEGANVGTAAIAAANIGASPWTYTAGTTPEYLHLRAGTVTGVTKNGVAVFAGLGQYYLLPGQSVVVTYTGTPVSEHSDQGGLASRPALALCARLASLTRWRSRRARTALDFITQAKGTRTPSTTAWDETTPTSLSFSITGPPELPG